MRKIIKDKSGSVTVTDMLICTVIILSIAFTALYMLTIFPQQYTLHTQAQAIAKAAEVTGGIGPEVDAVRSGLEKTSPIDRLEWKASKWLDSTRMQLHTPFTVTAYKVVEIKIFKPAFGESYPIKIELKAAASGLTEVYYKP